MRPFLRNLPVVALTPSLAGLMIITMIILLTACVAPPNSPFDDSEPVSNLPEPRSDEEQFQGKVEQNVVERVRAEGEVTVFVLFTDSEIMQQLQGAEPGSAEVFELLGALREENQARQEEVIAALAEIESENPVIVEIRYQTIPALLLQINEAQLTRLAELSDVESVGLDIGGGGAAQGGVMAMPATSPATSPFTSSWTGAGIAIAVLDSGYDLQSSEWSSTVIHEACFVDTPNSPGDLGGCPNGKRTQKGMHSAKDENGHGTAVTGILTSDGNGNPRPAGIAPESEIVAIRVLDKHNRFDQFADVLAGLEYVVSLKDDPNTNRVALVNVSVESGIKYTGDCDFVTTEISATKKAVDLLQKANILTFAAAGNNGRMHSMTVPACISSVVSVGNVGANNQFAGDSNRSSTLDLVAPGVNISSIVLSNVVMQKSGTSFATPYATGCAALWLEKGTPSTDILASLTNTTTGVTENGHFFPKAVCPPPN